jgi:tRNA threonylcarbamoyl adenosine modification protein (Sua5/YciO/YrdC/YwlC family)
LNNDRPVAGGSAPRSAASIVPVSVSAPDAAVVQQAAAVVAAGGVVAFPTDTLYAIGSLFGNAAAVERISSMRKIETGKRPCSLLLADVGQLPNYAQVSGSAYRIINRLLPGPYCIELAATAKALSAPGFSERKTLGLRIPNCELVSKLLWRLGRPMVSVTAKDQVGQTLTSAAAIAEAYGDALDLILDGGPQEGLPSTVISLVDDWVTVLRAGRGNTANIL